MVLVTHRLAMLALIDRLVVMDRGRVVADGPRDEVLKALSQARGADGPASPAAGPPPDGLQRAAIGGAP